MNLKSCLLFFLVAVCVSSEQPIKTEKLIRNKRAFEKIFGFFSTINEVKNIHNAQYNDTLTSLNGIYDILRNSFSDTATRPPPTISNNTETTTEAYTITRFEFGKILGRNYRGLKKLYDLEMEDALNATKENIREYKTAARNAARPNVQIRKPALF